MLPYLLLRLLFLGFLFKKYSMKDIFNYYPIQTILFFLILFSFITYEGCQVNNTLTLSEVSQVKVDDLQAQQQVSGSSHSLNTTYRYLVITNKGTFVCHSSWLNGKFNNSDLFFHLKKDSTYNFRVSGTGKSLLYDYQNILEVIK